MLRWTHTFVQTHIQWWEHVHAQILTLIKLIIQSKPAIVRFLESFEVSGVFFKDFRHKGQNSKKAIWRWNLTHLWYFLFSSQQFCCWRELKLILEFKFLNWTCDLLWVDRPFLLFLSDLKGPKGDIKMEQRLKAREFFIRTNLMVRLNAVLSVDSLNVSMNKWK